MTLCQWFQVKEPRVPSDAESRLLRISVLKRTREINILACELNILI